MKKNAAFYSTAMVVGVLLTFLYIFFGNTKIGYDGDELFSYMSSNMEGGYKKMLAYEDNAWHDTQIFGDALTVKEDNRFQYKMVAENQADDTHPPLYYFMLHTICSFFPNQFSKWFGISLNIVLMLASLVLIYFIAEHFLKNRWLSLTIAACFGATYGAINLVLFIRMYTLLLFLHTLLFYFTVRLWKKQSKITESSPQSGL